MYAQVHLIFYSFFCGSASFFCTARLWLFSCLMSQLSYFSVKCFTMFTFCNTFEDGSILCNCGNWRLKERSNLEHLSLPQKALKSFLWSDYIAVVLAVVLLNPGLIIALHSLHWVINSRTVIFETWIIAEIACRVDGWGVIWAMSKRNGVFFWEVFPDSTAFRQLGDSLMTIFNDGMRTA